ncbi:long-chain fatty acid--CoA ligase [bacterium]|nr:long-chain fatty acid--CoA ligase [candidate division CSSED10-310 bacterium]
MKRDEYSTLPRIFLETVQRWGLRPAIRYRSQERWIDMTLNDVRERVYRCTAALLAAGCCKGDHVAIMSNNRPEWFLADLGTLCAGAATVPIYSTLKQDQVRYIVEQSESRFMFVEDREQLGKIRHVLHDVPKLEKLIVFDPVGVILDNQVISFQEFLRDATGDHATIENRVLQSLSAIQSDDLASIVYTSGTTGSPKGVMLSHANFVSNIQDLKTVIDINERDIVLGILPLSHVLERCAGYYTGFLASGSMYVFTESMETVARDMGEIQPTIIVAVPRLFEKIYIRVMDMVKNGSGFKKGVFNWALQTGRSYFLESRSREVSVFLKQQYKLAHRLVFKKLHQRFGGRIKCFVSGGASLEPRIAQFFASIGITILEGYGLTETSPVNSVNYMGATRLGSVGKPLSSVSIRLAADGEILVKGPNVTRGYYRKPEETQELFDGEGWLKTGDIGRIDEDGFLWIIDRKKEIIVTSGGKNIAPQPIESMLTANPFISHAMLVGDRRNYISALIVPNFDTLKAWCLKTGLGDLTADQMVRTEEIYHKIQAEVLEVMAVLPRYEQVKRTVLLSRPWTVEGGELTPTMKLKRHVILKKYGSHIDALYRGDIKQP